MNSNSPAATQSTPDRYAERIDTAMRKLLPELREQRGWDIHEMGKVAGVTGQVIHNLETGRTKVSLQMLARLAHGLGVPLSDLTAILEQFCSGIQGM